MWFVGVIMFVAGAGWALISKSLFDAYNEQLGKDPTMKNELSPKFNAQRRDMFIGIGIAGVGVIVVISQIL